MSEGGYWGVFYCLDLQEEDAACRELMEELENERTRKE
jgi:hypothetical protein